MMIAVMLLCMIGDASSMELNDPLLARMTKPDVRERIRIRMTRNQVERLLPRRRFSTWNVGGTVTSIHFMSNLTISYDQGRVTGVTRD